eukprot:c27050_g1_i1.p1 GENE.c27050_g1_i1~~c27050_g1_i1.p1  ORF type:complete len:284 (-),score=69.90 c27050_g1_i1:117-968(-)
MSSNSFYEILLQEHKETRSCRAVVNLCCRLLAGLQLVINWKMGHTQRPEFRYTIGTLLHAIESLPSQDLDVVTSYFYVFVTSVVEGEKLSAKLGLGGLGLQRLLSNRQHATKKRMLLCQEILAFVARHIPSTKTTHASVTGPFPGLQHLEMPVFVSAYSLTSTSNLSNTKKASASIASPSPTSSPTPPPRTTPSHSMPEQSVARSGSFADVIHRDRGVSEHNMALTVSQVLCTIVRWLHGGFLGYAASSSFVPSNSLRVTDTMLSAEVQKLCGAMTRSRVGAP